VTVTVAETDVEDRLELGDLVDRFRTGKHAAVLVLFGKTGRGAVHVALTDDLVQRSLKAGDLVNRVAALSGGKGGGRPHFASAGAGDPTRLDEARAAVPSLVAGWLGG
jgi:alanyl-tRNA synthetase